MRILLGDFLNRMILSEGDLRFPFGVFEISCSDTRGAHRFKISVLEITKNGVMWRKERNTPGNPTPWPLKDMDEYSVDVVKKKKPILLGPSLAISVEAL